MASCCVVVATALLAVLLTAIPGGEACLSPNGFVDFEPTPLVAPGGSVEMAPVNVSASSVDDLNAELVSFNGDLYALWTKETGRLVPSENIMCRAFSEGRWGSELLAVNNRVPEEGSFEGEHIRVAGFDAAVHDGLLWVVWSTPDLNFTHGEDSDLVYRTFDGTTWSAIVELSPPDNDIEETQPTIASTDEGLLLAWTIANTGSGGGWDPDIEASLIDADGLGPIVQISPEGDEEVDFIPDLFTFPGGAYLTWHTRRLLPTGPEGSMENVVFVQGRSFTDGRWSDVQMVSDLDSFENIWVDALWDGERLCFVWQHGGLPYEFKATDIFYREWRNGAFSPKRDITSVLHGSVNGRPELGYAGGELRVYWHTNDDGVTPGDTFDIVWRARGQGGYWGPVEVFQAGWNRELLYVDLMGHSGGLYVCWNANVTYELEPPLGTIRVLDVWVAPAYLPPDPLEGVSVSHVWKRTLRAWGPNDLIRFRLERDGAPMGGALLEVRVQDPDGDVEAVYSGSTSRDGWVEFDHRFDSSGPYDMNVTVNEVHLGSVGLMVTTPPPGYLPTLLLTLALVVGVAMAFVAAGCVYVRRQGVVAGRKVAPGQEPPPRPAPWLWRTASRALTYVVKHKRAQGFLQMPLFVLFVVSMFIGFFGTQTPQKNFASMVGWAYYLAGMMLLYALFGRLWCYFEACGFVDTWCKLLIRRRRWLEWPSWLKNLWPGFLILLSGFWVEVVLSIDLFPWAVATYMLVTVLINLAISVNYGKRTYCRFVCRDGVVEELIARYSILRIGVRTRPESVPRGNPCIWRDEEKRPGYCAMCFTCVQNDPMVREATVEPAIRTFAEDVYKPQATHRDEATAAIVLMGISIPYMLGLSRLWWEGLFELSQGSSLALGVNGILVVLAGAVLATVGADRWAFRRWPRSFTTIRRALVVIVEVMLLSQLALYGLGGPVGRLIALRSAIVLVCFVVPFAIVYAGEWAVVRLTRNSRRETPWRLLERYGLVFIPVFLGVLVARNLPIVGTWGWAAWDIVKATFSDFPGGAATVVPRPFIDPALHFPIGVIALVVGLLVGSYAALQLSRRLYKEEGHALSAFGVHTALVTLFVMVFVWLLALPPF